MDAVNARYEFSESEVLRSNGEIEAAVNRGLAASMLQGVAFGAALMRADGVPLHVSMRVLGEPQRRRASDWQHNGVPQAAVPEPLGK
jgi:hypothetical protein